MQYIKPFKLFENATFDYFKDLVDMDIINDLKDISLDIFDDGYGKGYRLIYIVKLENFIIVSGHYQIEDDPIHNISNLSRASIDYLTKRNDAIKNWQHWTNYYPEHLSKCIETSKSEKFTYLFGIHTLVPNAVGPAHDFVLLRHRMLQDEASESIVLSRICKMYPDENIKTYDWKKS